MYPLKLVKVFQKQPIINLFKAYRRLRIFLIQFYISFHKIYTKKYLQFSD